MTPSQLVKVSSKEEVFSLFSECNKQMRERLTQEIDWVGIESTARQRFAGRQRKIELHRGLPFFMFQEDFNPWKQLEELKFTQVS